jgi:hypothetical protein
MKEIPGFGSVSLSRYILEVFTSPWIVARHRLAGSLDVQPADDADMGRFDLFDPGNRNWIRSDGLARVYRIGREHLDGEGHSVECRLGRRVSGAEDLTNGARRVCVPR